MIPAKRASGGTLALSFYPEAVTTMKNQYTDEQLQTGQKIRQMAEVSPYKHKAFYKTPEWERKRREILKRDRNACQECKRKGKYRKADTVHHIKHLKECPELALTDSNLESLCRDCHEEKHPERHKKKKDFWTPERW